MTDVRTEWISKRAYKIWEEAGKPDGRDGEHWQQAVRERDEFEKVALAADARPASAKKPLIEISKKARAAKPADKTAAPKKKKAADVIEKPAALKAVAKGKSAKATTNGKTA
jgi:hypothetical protein